MPHYKRDYCVLGLCSSSGALKNTFRKLDLFPSSVEAVDKSFSHVF
jgi:hypothetical protein